jgi:serine/threonine protein kinase
VGHWYNPLRIGVSICIDFLTKLPFEGGSTSDDVKKNIQTKSLKFPAKDRRGVEVVENQDRTNFIKGLLNRDVKQRLGSSNDGLGFEQDIKAHPFLADINWDLVKEKKQEPTFKPNVHLN